MATLTSKLIVALVDQVTAPSRAVASSIKRLTDAQAHNAGRLNAVRGQMLDAVGVGYALAKSLSAPVRAATEFETKLEDIAQKIDAPVSALPELGKQIREVARETTQSASAIADGMDVLTGMGASGDDAIGLLGPIGRATTAYNASIADLSQAGYAALDNLKVPAEQFGAALDAMAQAGKAGAFELKDMAQYFPELGAGYQALGQTGVSAVADLSAALQIVRKGTGDSASAATNLSNILKNIYAPRTVKNFKNMGIDLRKEMEKAGKAGLTPIEAIAEITNRALKGDLSKLGDLFNNAQVQGGLRPLLQNMELYREIRAEAMAAQGVVEEDYQRRLLTGAMAGQRFAIAIENINTSIGAALLPALAQLAETIVPIIDRMAAFAEANPRLVRTIIALTAGLVGLRVAAIAAQFGFLWMKGGLISAAIMGLRGLGATISFAAAPLSLLGGAARAGMAGLTLLLNPVRLVTAAFSVLRVALIGTGIGAALAALAMAGVWIYNNWSGIATMFEAFKGAFFRAIGPAMPALQPVIDGLGWLWDTVAGLLGPVDELGGSWAQMGIAAGKAVGEAVAALVGLPATIAEIWSSSSWSQIGQMMADGLRGLVDAAAAIAGQAASAAISAMSALWDGYKAAAGAAFAAVSGLMSSAFTAVDWGSILGGIDDALIGLFDLAAAGWGALDWSGTGELIGSAIAAGLSAMLDLGALIMSPFTSGGGGGDWGAIGASIGAAIGAGLVAFDWKGVGTAFINAIGAVLESGRQLVVGIVKGLFGDIDLLAEATAIVTSLRDGVSAVASQMVDAGRVLMAQLLEGIKAGGQAVLDYMTGLGSRLKNSITGAASGAWSSVKSAVGYGDESPAVAGARAAGGPVRAGGTYLVGEKGPELVTFPQAGFVHDALKTVRMLRNATMASAAMALPAAASTGMALPSAPAFDLSARHAGGAQGDQAAHGPSISIASGAVTITVQASPGQSPQEVAAEVERIFTAKLNAIGRGAYSDGAN